MKEINEILNFIKKHDNNTKKQIKILENNLKNKRIKNPKSKDSISTKKWNYNNIIFLKHLNLTNIDLEREDLQIELEKRKFIGMKEFVINYLELINHTNEYQNSISINKKLFNNLLIIFSHKYCDNIILKLIEKIYQDPGTYEKQQKSKFSILIFLSYFFLKNINQNLTKVKQKLLKFAVYIPFDEIEFPFHITEDVFIDSLTIKLFPFSNIQNIGIFMNYFKNLNCFSDFQEKFNRILLKIDLKNNNLINNHKKKYFVNKTLLELLKNIFVYNTVLYNKIDEYQLLNIIIKYYQNQIEKEIKMSENMCRIYKFFNILLKNLPQFYKKIVNIEFLKEKYFKFQIKSLNDLNHYKNYILNYKDSFINLNIIFSHINIIINYVDVINSKYIQQIYDLILFFVSNSSKKFIIKMISDFIRLFLFLFKFLVNNKSCILIKNSNNILSKFILYTQNYLKKKKKTKKFESNKANELIKYIRKYETKLEKNGVYNSFIKNRIYDIVEY